MTAPPRDYYDRFDTDYLLDLAKSDLTAEAREVLNGILRDRAIPEAQIQSARSRGEEDERVSAAEEERLAPRSGRTLAFVIDTWGCMLLAYLVTYPILHPLSAEKHANVAALLWGAYFLSKDWIPGSSLGKRLLRYKVVLVGTNQPISWWKSFVRNFAVMLQILDWLPALGKRRMRFGDMVAGTEVVRRVRVEDSQT